MKCVFLFCLVVFYSPLNGKEIALSFDDAPRSGSKHFTTQARTDELIRKLKKLNVPAVMIFSNPCARTDTSSVVSQLKKYKDAGHVIASHTCSHPRLDDVGFPEYAKDALKGDQILAPLFPAQKFFRYPYLNEGSNEKTRDQMRDWLKDNKYRHGMVSVDNDDYIFSYKINQATDQNKNVDYEKVEKLFIDHLVGAATFYDNLAIKTMGRSPKHVLLLHEMDVTVLYIDSLVNALRKNGWTIISAEEAYKDKLYLEEPRNTYSGNGIIAQVYAEKTGERVGYKQFDVVKSELNKILGLSDE